MKKLAFLALAIVAAACNGSASDDDPNSPGPSPDRTPPDATAEEVDAFEKLESSTHQRWSWVRDELSLRSPVPVVRRRPSGE